MMQYLDDSSKWYALFVLTGEEEKVRERLEYRFKDSKLKFIIPKRKLKERKQGKWEEKVRLVFPGYILVNGNIGTEEYYFFKEIPGLLRILKDSSGPLEIGEQDIKVINRLIRNSEIIEPSSILFKAGKIVVVDGPLYGLDGLIESIDKRRGRARVRINFAGEPRLVDLSVCIIEPVNV